MTKYFIDSMGNYLGGFDGANPPEGAIEIESPPNHGYDKWDGKKWILHTPPKTVEQLISEEFSKLPKDSRKKLRKFITEGFVAFQARNMQSVQDILEEAKNEELTLNESKFLTQIQSIVGGG